MPELTTNIGDRFSFTRYYNEWPFADVPDHMLRLLREVTGAESVLELRDDTLVNLWAQEAMDGQAWYKHDRYIEGTTLHPDMHGINIRRGLTLDSLLHHHPIASALQPFVPSGVTFARVTGSVIVVADERKKKPKPQE